MDKNIEVLGGVVVKGVEYINQDILKLLDIPFKRWKVAGDLDKDEGDILIKAEGIEAGFYGQDFLPRALAYLREYRNA